MKTNQTINTPYVSDVFIIETSFSCVGVFHGLASFWSDWSVTSMTAYVGVCVILADGKSESMTSIGQWKFKEVHNIPYSKRVWG
jgi:hypothetical protein